MGREKQSKAVVGAGEDRAELSRVLKIKLIKCGESNQLDNSLASGGNPGCLVFREIFQSPCCGGGLGTGMGSQRLPCIFSLPED